jgi:hypothetical protein
MYALPPTNLAAATRNICLMHLLERLAGRFNAAGVPLLVLKGAALNLTLYQRPDERPMGDLDLLVRAAHLSGARRLLDEAGCRRGAPLVREDFFPRYYYELDYLAGDVLPMKIDLHVRAFRPLRYARLVPADALWQRAARVQCGPAAVLVPAAEDMLIHLAVHAAVHDGVRPQWLADIKRWADARRSELDWDRLMATAAAWGLALPVRKALDRVQAAFGPVCPPEAWRRLTGAHVSWRDRLALWQAPRDARHSAGHVLVNALCTPGARFVIGYLRAVLVPDQDHMGQWYGRRHWGWLSLAHLSRWMRPLGRAVAAGGKRLARIATGAAHATCLAVARNTG